MKNRNLPMMRKLTVILAVVGTASCVRSNSCEETASLEFALRQAGSNRTELEKVLGRYSAEPGDSLKYQAAVFLIENMPGHSYYAGRQLDHYMEYYTLLRETMQAGLEPSAAVDSIFQKYGALDYSALSHLEDIQTVDSAYLCDNIELSFKVLEEQPWGKNVAFEDFCEYILPYRVGNETLADWRQSYYDDFNCILDSLRASEGPGKEDPIQAAQAVLSHIGKTMKPYFTMKAPAALPNAGPEAVRNNAGTCREFSDFVLYVCRALGIPCARDFMPIRGDDNSGHSWTAFWDKDGTAYLRDNEGPALRTKGSALYYWAKAKVYRQTFSGDRHKEHILRRLPAGDVPAIMRDVHLRDVSNLYSWRYADSLAVPDSAMYDGIRDEVVFLCVTSRMDWVPVDWTEVRDGRIVFKSVCRGNIFRIARIPSGHTSYLSDPFYVGDKGDIHIFRNDGKAQDITVFSKYPPAYFTVRMLGGVFEASDSPDFREKDTLHVITEKPHRLFTEVNVSPDRKYRYARYYGPPDGFCNVAEVSFHDRSGARLGGRVIGTPGSFDGKHGYENVCDGSTQTSFDYKYGYGGWSGMDFGKPADISEIVYTPRNYDNYVKSGDTYELFYLDSTWKSAGIVTASSDSIVFKDVPSGTLYLLKNHSGGVQERVFSYRYGRQLWDLENEWWFH